MAKHISKAQFTIRCKALQSPSPHQQRTQTSSGVTRRGAFNWVHLHPIYTPVHPPFVGIVLLLTHVLYTFLLFILWWSYNSKEKHLVQNLGTLEVSYILEPIHMHVRYSMYMYSYINESWLASHINILTTKMGVCMYVCKRYTLMMCFLLLK